MLSPKKVNHRKMHRNTNKRLGNVAQSGTSVAFGKYGLIALEAKLITNRQIEAARIAATRYMKRGGKMWIRIFPDFPYTKKPAETRMGKGKGNPEIWVAPVKVGKVMFELGGIEKSIAHRALQLAAQKLPIKAKIIERR